MIAKATAGPRCRNNTKRKEEYANKNIDGRSDMEDPLQGTMILTNKQEELTKTETEGNSKQEGETKNKKTNTDMGQKTEKQKILHHHPLEQND